MSLTSLNVLLGILTFAILSAALPQSGSCRCNGRISEKGNGECQTTHQGSAYCYVASGTCTDQQESSQAGWFWSFEACKKGSPVESSTPQKECTCDDHTERDDQGRETGNCLTEFRGSLWCYIDSTSKCEDKKQSSKNPSFYWSRIPCESNTDPQSVTPEERIRRRGNTTITNRVTSDMCTGDYKANGRPPSGTVCAKVDNKVCYVESGRWGNSYCYTDTGKKNWGAECVDCSARCTGDFKENGRPSSGTNCAKVDNKVCYVESGRWGKSWCYTDTDKKNWGAECVECSGIKSDRCTGNFKGNGRPSSGTKCAKVDNKVCYDESGYWGKSYCYTDTDKKNWGAECVECSAPSTNTNCQCGVKNMDQNRIVGGQEAGKNEYPWQVALTFCSDNSDLLYCFCGGTILTSKHILTAAHCTQGRAASSITVKVGEHDIRDPNDGQETVSVSSIKDHPDYDPDSYNYDMSILTLSEHVTFRAEVKPACLPNPSSNYDDITATVTGWGFLRENANFTQSKLHEVDIRTMSNSKCTGLYKPRKITDNMICAASPDKDSCQNDSGGPLIAPENGGQYYSLIGVVSWGHGCARENSPGVYARVTDQLDWIQDNIEGGRTCSSP